MRRGRGEGSAPLPPETAGIAPGPPGFGSTAILPINHPELELVYRQTIGRAARCVCVVGAMPGEGATTVAVALARRGAAGGLRTALVDTDVVNADLTRMAGLPRRRWSPTDRSAQAALGHGADRRGPAVLPAPAGAVPLEFRDRVALRRLFDDALAEYELIVVDTTAIGCAGSDTIPAEAVASACDATILVVLAGVTSERVVRLAVDRLAAADARLCGAVLNDYRNPSLADVLCGKVQRLAPLAPRLVAALQRRLRRSDLLNVQIG